MGRAPRIRQTPTRLILPALFAALALFLAACTPVSERDRAEEEFTGVFADDPAVAEARITSGVSRPHSTGWHEAEILTAADLDDGALEDLLGDVGEYLSGRDDDSPVQSVTVISDGIHLNVFRADPRVDVQLPLLLDLRSDPDVEAAFASVSAENVSAYLTLVTPDPEAVPGLYDRWGETYDGLSGDGNGTLTITDVSGAFAIEAYHRDWETLDLSAVGDFREEYGVTRFVRSPESLEVHVRDESDIDAATEAARSFVREWTRVTVSGGTLSLEEGTDGTAVRAWLAELPAPVTEQFTNVHAGEGRVTVTLPDGSSLHTTSLDISDVSGSGDFSVIGLVAGSNRVEAAPENLVAWSELVDELVSGPEVDLVGLTHDPRQFTVYFTGRPSDETIADVARGLRMEFPGDGAVLLGFGEERQVYLPAGPEIDVERAGEDGTLGQFIEAWNSTL